MHTLDQRLLAKNGGRELAPAPRPVRIRARNCSWPGVRKNRDQSPSSVQRTEDGDLIVIVGRRAVVLEVSELLTACCARVLDHLDQGIHVVVRESIQGIGTDQARRQVEQRVGAVLVRSINGLANGCERTRQVLAVT